MTVTVRAFTGLISNTGNGIWLDSIATLRLLDSSSVLTNIAYVVSYYTNGGKGGGTFWHDGTSVDADDGFLTIVSTDGRRWRRIIGPEGVDAYMAGAYGDAVIDAVTGVVSGAHDDTAALNKVLNYIRVNRNGVTRQTPVVAAIGAGVFRCNSRVSGAGIIGGARWVLDGTGAVIASRAQNSVAFDITNSTGGSINDLVVYGDPTAKPHVGVFISRVQGSTGDWRFERLWIKGEFTYAAFHNSGDENVSMEQVFFQNMFRGPCYGLAQDCMTYLRYELPKFETTHFTISATNPLRFNHVAHGLTTGDEIFPTLIGGVTAANGRRYTVTVVDADHFTIPVQGSGYTSGGRYCKARYIPDPNYVTQAQDTIEPMRGDGAFTLEIAGGQTWAPYGIAGMLDTPGGRRKVSIRLVSGWHDDPSTGDIAITSITAATKVFVTGAAHNLVVGDLLRVNDTSDNDRRNWKVATTPTGTTLTVVNLDDTVATTLVDSTGGTLHRQMTRGGYGVHWMYFDNPATQNAKYENVHHEAANGNFTHALALISSIESIANNSGPQPVIIGGMRFAEHAARGAFGGFDVDTTTVSSVVWTGELSCTTAAPFGGEGGAPGKWFLHPSLWTVSGLFFFENPNVIDPAVIFTGITLQRRTGEWIQPPSTSNPLVVKTANYTLTNADAGKLFNNLGAVGSVTLTLPAAGSGLIFHAANVVDGQPLIFQAVGTDTITHQGRTSGNAGTLTSSTAFSTATIRATGSRRWIVESGNQEVWRVSGNTYVTRCFHTGGSAPFAAASGTDATPATNETYISEVDIDRSFDITGVSLLLGSANAGNVQIFLADRAGTVVASTASTAAAAIDDYQRVPFTASYAAPAGTYYICLQCNNVGNRYRAHPIGTFGASVKAATVYGTLASITSPTTFTASKGPIATLY